MNLLVTQRHGRNAHGDWTDSLENRYVRFLECFGAAVIAVPNDSDNFRKLLLNLKIDGIILSGGGDVDPSLYGGLSGENCAISKKRDETEAFLIAHAVAAGVPLLGMCRGMQFINVFFGGRLIQDIKKIDGLNVHPTPCVHDVKIVEPRLRDILAAEVVSVNSYHNQGVAAGMLGDGLKAFAVNEKLNIVEGFYHAERKIAGIQWHPERNESIAEIDKILIESFIGGKLFWSDKK